MESKEAISLVDYLNLQKQKNYEMKKEQGNKVEAIVNSFANKMEQMKNIEIKILVNSSHTEMLEKTKTITCFTYNEMHKSLMC